MKTGKSFKVFGFRGSLVGDGIMSLVLLNWVRKRFPDCYTYWQIARQHAHAAPLYFNHPLIDQIVISDCDEGMGPRDREIAAQCDLVFDVMPQHPLQHDWPNHRDIYAETFAMGALPLGIPLSEYESMTEEEKRPRLTKWFKVIKEPPKTIAIWPCAGYGVENKRNPSKEWYDVLISQLIEAGYRINQYGHPRDFAIKGVQDMRQIGFFDQVKQTVGCDMVISTDSGSGLIFGAYQMPQISLLTNHFPGHVRNLTAFAPNNPFNRSFVGVGSADRINQTDIISKVCEILT